MDTDFTYYLTYANLFWKIRDIYTRFSGPDALVAFSGGDFKGAYSSSGRFHLIYDRSKKADIRDTVKIVGNLWNIKVHEKKKKGWFEIILGAIMVAVIAIVVAIYAPYILAPLYQAAGSIFTATAVSATTATATGAAAGATAAGTGVAAGATAGTVAGTATGVAIGGAFAATSYTSMALSVAQAWAQMGIKMYMQFQEGLNDVYVEDEKKASGLEASEKQLKIKKMEAEREMERLKGIKPGFIKDENDRRKAELNPFLALHQETATQHNPLLGTKQEVSFDQVRTTYN
jgi:hypothetical protein